MITEIDFEGGRWWQADDPACTASCPLTLIKLTPEQVETTTFGSGGARTYLPGLGNATLLCADHPAVNWKRSE